MDGERGLVAAMKHRGTLTSEWSWMTGHTFTKRWMIHSYEMEIFVVPRSQQRKVLSFWNVVAIVRLEDCVFQNYVVSIA